MVLPANAPKCRELVVNAESESCPLCGILFREYRIKRLIFWLAILVIAAWALHDHIHIPSHLHFH